MRIFAIVMMVLILVVYAHAGERSITSADRSLLQSLPCNGKVEGPVYIRSIFKGASIPQYICYHIIDDSTVAEVVLIYIYNHGDGAFELIKAMRLNEYWDVVDRERSMQE